MTSLIEKIAGFYGNVMVRIVHITTASIVADSITGQYRGEPLYHASGFLTALLFRCIDHISTLNSIKIMDRPEFRKAGLEKEFYESNPLTGKHPSLQRYAAAFVPVDLFYLALSTILPPLGYAGLSLSPAIAINNKCREKEIVQSLDVLVDKQ